jgi:hypothetical protein
MSIPLDEFYKGTAAAESGGDPNAKNPLSSATGLYQFTNDTWAGVVRNYGERYGIRPDGVMDADQQNRAIRAITENEYLPVVRRGGRPITPAELYAPHLLGAPTYSRMAAADPNARAVDVVPNWVNDRGRGVFQANTGVFKDPNITVGEALQRINNYYTRKAGGPVNPRKAPGVNKVPSPVVNKVPPQVASSPAPTAEVSSISKQSTRLLQALKNLFKPVSRKE